MKKGKKTKQRLAVLLAVLLMLPSQPFSVAATLSENLPKVYQEQNVQTNDNQKGEENAGKQEKELKDDANAGASDLGKKDEVTNSGESKKDESKDEDAGSDESKKEEGSDENGSKDEDADSKDSESDKEDKVTDSDESKKDENGSDEDESKDEDADSEDSESGKEDKVTDSDESKEDKNDSDEDESKDEDADSKDSESGKEDEVTDSDESKKEESSDKNDSEKDETDLEEDSETDEDLKDEENQEELTPEEEEPLEEEQEELPELIGEEIIFNTGNQACTVVNESDFVSYEMGDVYFDEDGSYTIQIPEENPFFPYEVQFTYKDKVRTEWFMTPDDSVKLGDHIFYVNAEFDGTVVTQMSLEVAGDEVIVYPAKKKFTDGDGAEEASLLPLEERRLTVDLSAYTPMELSMVLVESIFTGDNALSGSEKVVWHRNYNKENYQIASSGEYLNLNANYNSATWEMIVGDGDQLNASNVRYIVDVETTYSEEMFISSLYAQAEDGTRVELEDLTYRYYHYYRDLSPSFSVTIYNNDIKYNKMKVFAGLQLNEELFPTVSYSELKAFEENLDSVEAVQEALQNGTNEITDEIFSENLTQTDSGWLIMENRYYIDDKEITLVALNASGELVGYLPMEYSIYHNNNHVSASLYTEINNQWRSAYDTYHSKIKDGIRTYLMELYQDCAVNTPYYLQLTYHEKDKSNPEKVTAAYLGIYDSIAEARSSNAKEIKEQLFTNTRDSGYLADYSEGVAITIFVGKDGADGQEIYKLIIKTEEGTESYYSYSSTYVSFSGLSDAEGNTVDSYVVETDEDSYGENNFVTILVDDSVDLTALAPRFYLGSSVSLYAEGSSSAEISGESIHDFSDGPIQYTAAAENGKDSKNYWLQVVQEGSTSLYLNSLAVEEAETEIKDGVIYSTREIFLDGRHDYYHDILLINMDSASLDNLSAELVSDQVKLDDYWTLSGKFNLSAFSGVETTKSYGELANMAKLRLVAKDKDQEATDISGTLTIQSGGTTLMVLTLTGTMGDPCITTEEIPAAVRYVPYGTMIQNNNRYSDNRISYYLSGGKLPEGMKMKSNGELYGVPKETGEFAITVRMYSSYGADSMKDYTLVVTENTDENVESATDIGYELSQKLPEISLYATADFTLVSQGVYNEFRDVFLDGEKLKAGEDYTSESGSTRITIKSQTLKANGAAGTHTIGVEFRSGSNKELKRAAQNYKVSETGSMGGSSSNGNGSGSGGVSNGGSNNSSSSNSGSGNGGGSNGTSKDATKGFMNTASGIVTGDGAGYSKWQQDGTAWKLLYADGTFAAGTQITLEDGSQAEQVLWEKINGRWYAFGADGALKAGWVYDYQLGSWYALSIENGMQSGWYTASDDGFTYYLDPETGKLAVGWQQIAHDWYLFNPESQGKTWLFDEKTGLWYYDILSKKKPLGAMYRSERTPDGYWVDENGAWDGKR